LKTFFHICFKRILRQDKELAVKTVIISIKIANKPKFLMKDEIWLINFDVKNQ